LRNLGPVEPLFHFRVYVRTFHQRFNSKKSMQTHVQDLQKHVRNSYHIKHHLDRQTQAHCLARTFHGLGRQGDWAHEQL
jgi:hypothetical protein